MCAYVPIVPSQKENRLLTFERSSHQCLISLGGEWMLIIASILKPHWEFHIEGRVEGGERDILILGLRTRGRMFSANLGPERLLGSLAGSQPFCFCFSQHAFPI